MQRILHNIGDICNQYNIDDKISDLMKLLDLLKLNKSNIRYLIKLDTFSNKCDQERCNRNSCYFDIVNKKYVCWFHAYENTN